MKRAHRIRSWHRRDWRRLWRYCRCGYRWRCPDSVELVPTPYRPGVPAEPAVPQVDRSGYPESVGVSTVSALPAVSAESAVSALPAVSAESAVSAVSAARVRAGNQRAVGRLPGRNRRLAAAPTASAARSRHAGRVPS